MLLTARDRELVAWIGRFGAVEADQVMGWFGVGRTAAYRRLRACVDAELVPRVRVLHGEPGLYVASAVNGSLSRPVLCLPSPCGSGPTGPAKPYSSSRSASR